MEIQVTISYRRRQPSPMRPRQPFRFFLHHLIFLISNSGFLFSNNLFNFNYVHYFNNLIINDHLIPNYPRAILGLFIKKNFNLKKLSSFFAFKKKIDNCEFAFKRERQMTFCIIQFPIKKVKNIEKRERKKKKKKRK